MSLRLLCASAYADMLGEQPQGALDEALEEPLPDFEHAFAVLSGTVEREARAAARAERREFVKSMLGAAG